MAQKAQNIPLRIRVILIAPPPQVRYGVQRGSGSAYEVDFAEEPRSGDVTFEFEIGVVEGKDGQPDFRGHYVQGKRGRRFIYVDVGRYARQHDTTWARRMIIRLDDITSTQIKKAAKEGKPLEARIPGTAGDGGPNCATVNIVGGWQLGK